MSSIDATIEHATSFGTLNTVRGLRMTAVVWECNGREVWIGESIFAGRKRAIIEVLRDPRVRRTIGKLEDDAGKRIEAQVGTFLADFAVL